MAESVKPLVRFAGFLAALYDDSSKKHSNWHRKFIKTKEKKECGKSTEEQNQQCVESNAPLPARMKPVFAPAPDKEGQ